MEETISVRLPKKDLSLIGEISKEKNVTKSTALRGVVHNGRKEEMLELALDKYRKEEITASRGAKIAGIPLTKFLDILFERKINFHFDVEDLREDAKNLGLL